MIFGRATASVRAFWWESEFNKPMPHGIVKNAAIFKEGRQECSV